MKGEWAQGLLGKKGGRPSLATVWSPAKETWPWFLGWAQVQEPGAERRYECNDEQTLVSQRVTRDAKRSGKSLVFLILMPSSGRCLWRRMSPIESLTGLQNSIQNYKFIPLLERE